MTPAVQLPLFRHRDPLPFRRREHPDFVHGDKVSWEGGHGTIIHANPRTGNAAIRNARGLLECRHVSTLLNLTRKRPS